MNCFETYSFPLSNEEDGSKTEPDTEEDLMERLPPYLPDEEPANLFSSDNGLAIEESDDISLFIPMNNEEQESDDDDECILDEPIVSVSEAKDCNDIVIIQLLKKTADEI